MFATSKYIVLCFDYSKMYSFESSRWNWVPRQTASHVAVHEESHVVFFRKKRTLEFGGDFRGEIAAEISAISRWNRPRIKGDFFEIDPLMVNDVKRQKIESWGDFRHDFSTKIAQISKNLCLPLRNSFFFNIYLCLFKIDPILISFT